MEIKVKAYLNKINKTPNSRKKTEIKGYLKQLVDMYSSGTITSTQLGYCVTSLVQYKKGIPASELFSEILKIAGVIELPDTQVEKKGYDRNNLTENLVLSIKKYLY